MQQRLCVATYASIPLVPGMPVAAYYCDAEVIWYVSQGSHIM